MKHFLLIAGFFLSLSAFSQKLDTTVMSTNEKLAWKRIESYRERVVAGETMASLATLYSEDPGSAKNGGRYDNMGRDVFVPEFEKVAFSLKVGEVSEVFQTVYGFHFIQLIAAHDELVNLRHILITTTTNSH